MTGGGRFFCADAARIRNDQLAGTAPYGTVWILIEYRQGWPVNGFDGLALDPATKAVVYAAAQRARARILLVRRTGRRRPGAESRWAVLRHDASGALLQQWGTWCLDTDLAQVAQALTTGGASGLPPVALVCTHGTHDACCAVRGRPVAAALAERWPDLVWECSHVGGDRFAPNLVVVPDGVYYGGLDADTSLSVLEDHLADRIRPDHLRGYTNLAPPQQAALIAVLRRFGPAGRHDYAVGASVRSDEGWHIRLTGRPPYPAVIDVEVTVGHEPARQLTCRGPAKNAAARYDVTSVRAR
ncbi:hypothetical protein SAMN05216251_1105 [Actinacidiphila alni]|uniref:Sucrase ferredoxin n=1 Tax=Actinacidiphila alni TaxID=380248 RepID=A0A1I2H1P0_9ACTN|nr:sucrase ferredoxin [Actinacidiphila alni]SFF23189.1 hypothetical protein SAMN05216251_1105 [Actinacidiphila alni]